MTTLEERFWRKVDIRGPKDCWPWTAGTHNDGYGWFRTPARPVLAHRFAYESLVGPIPDGIDACHHCDNRRCCNPYHLFLGTHADNNHDRDRKGRQRTQHGSNHPLAKLTERSVIEIRQRVAAGERQNALAREFGVSPSVLNNAARGKSWAHVVEVVSA